MKDLRTTPLRLAMIHTKFHIDYFRHSTADKGDTQTYREQGDLISLLLYFENRKSRLKTDVNTLQIRCLIKTDLSYSTLETKLIFAP